MQAWRMLAWGHGSVLFAAFLAASLSIATAAQGQDGPAEYRAKSMSRARAVAERLQRKLQEPTEFTFAETPLVDALDVLQVKHDIPIAVDHKALTDAGLGTDARSSLAVRGIRLESALALLLEPLELTWVIHDEVVVITTREEAESLLSIQVYPVGDLLKKDKIGSDYVVELVTAVVQVSPTEWDEMGGPSAIEVFGDSLVISATFPMHAKIARLLADVRRAYDPGAPVAEVGDAERAALKALETPMNVALLDAPLIDACKSLSEQFGTQILLHDKSLAEAGVDQRTPVSLHAQGVTLRSALNRLLSPLELAWAVRNEVLIVHSTESYEDSRSLRVHPLGELVGDEQGNENVVEEMITMMVGPTAWEESEQGNPMSLPGLLLVRQTDQVQVEIADLLQQLRGGVRAPEAARDDRAASADGFRRAVYDLNGLNPDDVVGAIKTIIAPDSWQAGQGSILVIRADPATNPWADVAPGGGGANGGGGKAEPGAAVRGASEHIHAQMGGMRSSRFGHRLVVIQRPDAHAEIRKFLAELNDFWGSMGTGSTRGAGGGGFFRD